MCKGTEGEINLMDFLSGIGNDMLPAFREKGLDITIVNSNDLTISTDVEKLERVIQNIISNSLKFMEKGGVRIDYGIDGRTFSLEIKDTGKGIPEKELPLIFNRFYRGESGLKD